MDGKIEKTKGVYEVLRARKAGRANPLIVFSKADVKEHLTVMDRDMGVVVAFLRDKKKPQTNADRIRSMTDEELANMLDEVVMNGIMALDKNYPCNDCVEKINCDICFLEWLQTERSK